MVSSRRARIKQEKEQLRFMNLYRFSIIGIIPILIVVAVFINHYTTDVVNTSNNSSENTVVQAEDEENSNDDNTISYRGVKVYPGIESTNIITFALSSNTSGARPESTLSGSDTSDLNALYLGHDSENKVYLTFNAVNSNSKAEYILDMLKNHNIHGTFFVSKDFINKNKDTVLRMVDEGHAVGLTLNGNISSSELASKSTKNFVDEITSAEDAFKDATNTENSKLFRFRNGKFTRNSLECLKNIGYKSVFYSYTSYDKGEEDTTDRTLNLMKSYYHQGAIYDLDDNNKGTTGALDQFITEMSSNNAHTFDTIDNI